MSTDEWATSKSAQLSIKVWIKLLLLVVVVMVVHGHFWTSGSSGSILQRFHFKLLVHASRVAKILELVQLRFWWWSMDTFGLVALVALYCNGLASNSWYVLVG